MSVASPDEIEAGLRAIVREGTAYRASLTTGIASSTLYQWAKQHADRLREMTEESSRARAILVEAEATATLEAIAEGRQIMATLMRSDAVQANARVAAFSALVNLAKGLDGQTRLDRGEPTSIEDKADKRTDAELAREVQRLLARPDIAAELRQLAPQ